MSQCSRRKVKNANNSVKTILKDISVGEELEIS